MGQKRRSKATKRTTSATWTKQRFGGNNRSTLLLTSDSSTTRKIVFLIVKLLPTQWWLTGLAWTTCRYMIPEAKLANPITTLPSFVDFTTHLGPCAKSTKPTQGGASETSRRQKTAAPVEARASDTFAATTWTGATSRAPVTFLKGERSLIETANILINQWRMCSTTKTAHSSIKQSLSIMRPALRGSTCNSASIASLMSWAAHYYSHSSYPFSLPHLGLSGTTCWSRSFAFSAEDFILTPSGTSFTFQTS